MPHHRTSQLFGTMIAVLLAVPPGAAYAQDPSRCFSNPAECGVAPPAASPDRAADQTATPPPQPAPRTSVVPTPPRALQPYAATATARPAEAQLPAVVDVEVDPTD